MSLSPSILTQQMITQCAGKRIVGVSVPNFCKALSTGLITAFKSMNQVISQDTGLQGVGVGVGKIVGIKGPELANITYPLVLANGIAGIDSRSWIEAISLAIVNHFLAFAVSQTVHPVVAIGSGTGKILNLIPGTMTSLIVAQMLANGISGTMMQPLINGVSQGFCIYFLASAQVSITIAGAPIPPPKPAAGTGTGKIS